MAATRSSEICRKTEPFFSTRLTSLIEKPLKMVISESAVIRCLLLLLYPFTLYLQAQIMAYDAPGNYPYGLAWDGQYLWVGDAKTWKFYKLDPNAGLAVIASYDHGGYGDLTWDGSNFWTMAWSTLEKYEIIDSAFVKVESYEFRPYLHHMRAVAWDGQYFWTTADAGGFFKHDPANGYQVIQFIDGPNVMPTTIEFDDQYLWITDRGMGMLYQCARDSAFTLLAKYPLPGPYPTGVAWDGQHLWTCDWSTGKIYQHLSLSTEPVDPEDEILPDGVTPTIISNDIASDTRWTIAHSPYLVPTGFEIKDGATLTIDPGVKVFFEEGASLTVKGILRAVGSPDSLIVFSHRNADQTWGLIIFQNGTNGQDEASILQYCKIQYALDIPLEKASPRIQNNLFRRIAAGITGTVRPNSRLEIRDNVFYFAGELRVDFDGNDFTSEIIIDGNHFIATSINSYHGILRPVNLTISNNFMERLVVSIILSGAEGITITNNHLRDTISAGGISISHSRNIIVQDNIIEEMGAGGIGVGSNSYNIEISGNTIINNFQGIAIGTNSEVNLRFNNIHDNFFYNIEMIHSAADVDATYNWWGTTDSTEIAQQIFDYYDNPRNGRVLFVPFLNSPTTPINNRVRETPIENFRLWQNYPNPFNSQTIIKYALPRAARVRLTIYNLQGRLVAKPVDQYQPAGYHEVKWDASGMASGMYFYRLKAGSFSRTRRLLILK